MAGVIAIIGAVAAGVGALTSAGIGIGGKVQANKRQRIEDAKARRMQKKLEAFEANRQAVLNQAEDIRGLKSQVFNPYANLAVANKAAELKIEQTDEALANTLDQINRSGTGAGAATALARMAATSKAQVGATIENQEVKNQQLRVSGEASMIAQKMKLEQAALGAEGDAWGRQETRDLASLDRLSGLQENAQAQALAYQQGGDQMLMSGMQGFAQGMSSMGGAMMGMGGGAPAGVAAPDQGGLWGYGDVPTGTTGGMTAQGAVSQAPSDRRIKENVKFIGLSPSGLKKYIFEYINSNYGEGVYQGVMSDEIPQEAVIIGDDGFDRVNYSKLDVEFKKLS